MKTRKPKITLEVELTELIGATWMLSLVRKEDGLYVESICLNFDEPLADLQLSAERLVRILGSNAVKREIPFEDRREYLTAQAQKSHDSYQAAYLSADTDERRDKCARMVDYHLKELTALRAWTRQPLAKAACPMSTEQPPHVFSFVLSITPHGTAVGIEIHCAGKLISREAKAFPDPFSGFQLIADKAKGLSDDFGDHLKKVNGRN